MMRTAVVTIALAAAALSWAITTYAAPIDDLAEGYPAGTWQSDNPEYAALYAQTTDRTLTLHAVTEQEGRTAAIYELGYTHAGGSYTETGVMVLRHDTLALDTYEADPDELTSIVDASITGQAADIATTALALSNGWSEGNPVVDWLIQHPAGIAAIIALKIGASHVADELSLETCVTVRKAVAVTGWGPAAWNASLMLGATPPVAGVLAILAAWRAHVWAQSDAPLRCAGINSDGGSQ